MSSQDSDQPSQQSQPENDPFDPVDPDQGAPSPSTQTETDQASEDLNVVNPLLITHNSIVDVAPFVEQLSNFIGQQLRLQWNQLIEQNEAVLNQEQQPQPQPQQQQQPQEAVNEEAEAFRAYLENEFELLLLSETEKIRRHADGNHRTVQRRLDGLEEQITDLDRLTNQLTANQTEQTRILNQATINQQLQWIQMRDLQNQAQATRNDLNRNHHAVEGRLTGLADQSTEIQRILTEQAGQINGMLNQMQRMADRFDDQLQHAERMPAQVPQQNNNNPIIITHNDRQPHQGEAWYDQGVDFVLHYLSLFFVLFYALLFVFHAINVHIYNK